MLITSIDSEISLHEFFSFNFSFSLMVYEIEEFLISKITYHLAWNFFWVPFGVYGISSTGSNNLTKSSMCIMYYFIYLYLSNSNRQKLINHISYFVITLKGIYKEEENKDKQSSQTSRLDR